MLDAEAAVFYRTGQCLSRGLIGKRTQSFGWLHQPLMVSAVHTGRMEVAFAKRALKDPDLQTAHNVHKMSSFGWSFVHSWRSFPRNTIHSRRLASRCSHWPIGVGTCNKLLQ